MSLVIDLPPAQESQLKREAERQGTTVDELVSRSVARLFPTLDEETVRAIELIDQWIASAPTDPEKIREAEEDLLTFQRAINETRANAGARLLYPDVK
jgi:hypothetical protein